MATEEDMGSFYDLKKVMVQQVSGDAVLCLMKVHQILFLVPVQKGPVLGVLYIICVEYGASLFSTWKESERVIPSLRVAGNFENLKVGVVLSIDCCS